MRAFRAARRRVEKWSSVDPTTTTNSRHPVLGFGVTKSDPHQKHPLGTRFATCTTCGLDIIPPKACLRLFAGSHCLEIVAAVQDLPFVRHSCLRATRQADHDWPADPTIATTSARLLGHFRRAKLGHFSRVPKVLGHLRLRFGRNTRHSDIASPDRLPTEAHSSDVRVADHSLGDRARGNPVADRLFHA